MTRAVCPGSYDPVTYGHLDVIGRTAQLAEEVIVAVGSNVAKRGLLTTEERVRLLTEACAPWPSVTVSVFRGLLVDFCAEQQVDVISKGLRPPDAGYELAMAQMNRRLTGVDTWFLPTAAEWSFVSSSLVREVAGLGGDISAFVPPAVAALVGDRVRERAFADPGA